MTALSILQAASSELGLAAPSAAFSSTDAQPSESLSPASVPDAVEDDVRDRTLAFDGLAPALSPEGAHRYRLVPRHFTASTGN
jgi:hypothetical protein